MKLDLKCPKCSEAIELIVNDDELKNALLITSSVTSAINNLVVIPTWKCGLSCPYCAYHQQEDSQSILYTDKYYHVEKELTPDEWIKLLNSFAPAVYDFSGGEPLRYSGIVNVLNSLPLWAITSNTLHFSKDIDLSRCRSWTASYHPHIPNEAKQLFLNNTDYIRSKGVPIGITLVATPKTLESVLAWADTFHSVGFQVNIHPYYDDKNFSWYNYPEEMKRLKISPYLRYDEKLFEYKGLSGSGYCRGGQHYFAIGPDGKVFRCLTDLLMGKTNIGGLVNCNCNDTCYYPCDWSYGGRK
jgi:sulfatase maturation enzyme AslB (radical SAM superfamily)